jgi:PKD repeat protein
MAVSTLILFGAGACGGDGGGVEPNTDPVANFTFAACVEDAPCQFTDASSDPDGTIASRAWDFGDPASGANTSDELNPVHTFSGAGSFNVRLTVTDNGGKTNSKTVPVTVTGTGGGGNTPPVASFVLPLACTAGTPCGFHSSSTDAEGDETITSALWDFGDGETGQGNDATHTYDQAGTYTVVLAVTDAGGATATTSQQLTVGPAASQSCTTTGTRVDCPLTVTQRSTVRFTVQATNCELVANTLTIRSPREQTVFFHLCNREVGDEYVATDATGAPLVLEAGTVLAVRFLQGTAGPGNPASGDPGIQVEATGANNWTLNIDDGGNAGAEGEPDFDDAVITVTATPAP